MFPKELAQILKILLCQIYPSSYLFGNKTDGKFIAGSHRGSLSTYRKVPVVLFQDWNFHLSWLIHHFDISDQLDKPIDVMCLHPAVTQSLEEVVNVWDVKIRIQKSFLRDFNVSSSGENYQNIPYTVGVCYQEYGTYAGEAKFCFILCMQHRWMFSQAHCKLSTPEDECHGE